MVFIFRLPKKCAACWGSTRTPPENIPHKNSYYTLLVMGSSLLIIRVTVSRGTYASPSPRAILACSWCDWSLKMPVITARYRSIALYKGHREIQWGACVRFGSRRRGGINHAIVQRRKNYSLILFYFPSFLYDWQFVSFWFLRSSLEIRLKYVHFAQNAFYLCTVKYSLESPSGRATLPLLSQNGTRIGF